MGFGNIMKQAKEMQEKMQGVHDELANMQVAGQAGGGLVKVIMTGRHDIRNLFIDPSVIKDAANEDDGGEGRKVLQELLASAVNGAVQKIEEATREKMANMAQGFQMPEGFEGLMGGGQGEGA